MGGTRAASGSEAGQRCAVPVNFGVRDKLSAAAAGSV